MDHSQILTELGLSSKAAAIYLALLELGQASVLQISRQTGLKRPTVYLVLDELIEAGYIVVVPQEKKKLYLALPPDRLLEKLDQKKDALIKSLPQLSALYRAKSERPSVRLFEGAEGIRNVYREMTSTKKGEMLSFYSLGLIPKEYEENYDLFIRMLKNDQVREREIIYMQEPDHPYLKKIRKMRGYSARVTNQPQPFPTDNIVSGNKVALISFQKKFALVVESEDIATSLRMLFELAWLSARPL